MRYLLIPLIAAACGTQSLVDSPTAARSGDRAPASASSAASGVEHSVVGSGTQKIAPGFEYSTNISVRSDADGNVEGESTTRIIDLSAYGYPGSGEIKLKPVCMRVVGNTAWVRLVVTKTFDENFAHVGDGAIFWVRDGGAAGADVGHGGPAGIFDASNMICTTTPPQLPPDPFTSGNFVVR